VVPVTVTVPAASVRMPMYPGYVESEALHVVDCFAHVVDWVQIPQPMRSVPSCMTTARPTISGTERPAATSKLPNDAPAALAVSTVVVHGSALVA